MKAINTSEFETKSVLLTPTTASGSAQVAHALLAQPELGITRIAYVGLPEREAVGLVIDARYSGLRAEAARGPSGKLTVRISAPPELAQPPESVARWGTGPSASQTARTWLCAGSRWIIGLLGRRVP
jgi:hypothetical protein